MHVLRRVFARAWYATPRRVAAGAAAMLVFTSGVPVAGALSVPSAPTTTSTTSPTRGTTSPPGTTSPAGAASPTTTLPPTVQLDTADDAFLAGVSARLHTAEASLAQAQRVLHSAERAAAAATAAAVHADQVLDTVAAREHAAVVAVTAARAHVRDLAVSAYVSGGAVNPISAFVGAGSVSELSQRTEILDTVARVEVHTLDRYDQARQQASQDALHALGVAQRAEAAKIEADQADATASDLVATRTEAVSNIAQLLHLVTAALSVPGTDIPRLLLDAYQRAAGTVQAFGCALPWAALAGIGKVESDHGRAQHAQLTLAGDIVPPIIGPALDGTNGTQLIPDRDAGQWDGDTAYAHAIGPMQFIETTWAHVARDGNGDGTADPNNAYDAALSAAVYLCHAAPAQTLNTDDGLRQAFFSYNHSPAYVDEVLTLTHVYAAAPIG